MRHEAVGRGALHVAGGKAKALQRSERCDGCASYAADVESAKSAYNQGNECHQLPAPHPTLPILGCTLRLSLGLSNIS